MEIVSGAFGDPGSVADYRVERLGDVLVERIVWGPVSAPRLLSGLAIADAGYVWFRFWISGPDQVVEKYYDPQGRLVGTQIDVCAPITCDEDGCRAVDLLLDIWIAPDGRVTVHGEDAFERAVAQGRFDAECANHAETRLRRLTAAIARGRFPPPIVRNWQLDPTRLAVRPQGAD